MGYNAVVHEILENEAAHEVTLFSAEMLLTYTSQRKRPIVLESARKEVYIKKKKPRQKLYFLT